MRLIACDKRTSSTGNQLPAFLIFLMFLASRIVIPRFVRRQLVARRALGFLPLIETTGANSASPESVPDGAATGHAGPAIIQLWAVFALWAVNFRFLIHSGFLVLVCCNIMPLTGLVEREFL
jgi:hypothetical protein